MAASRAGPCNPAGGLRSPPRRSSWRAARAPHGCKTLRGPSPRPCPAPATGPCQARPTSSNQNPSPRSWPTSSPALRATGPPPAIPRNDGDAGWLPGTPALTAWPRTTDPREIKVDLQYSDGIAAARTMIALEGNAAVLQHRLPSGWELAGDPAVLPAAGVRPVNAAADHELDDRPAAGRGSGGGKSAPLRRHKRTPQKEREDHDDAIPDPVRLHTGGMGQDDQGAGGPPGDDPAAAGSHRRQAARPVVRLRRP